MATQTATRPKTTTATAADLLTPRPRPEPGAGRAAGRQLAQLADDVVESITRLKMKYVGPVAAELVATAKAEGWSLEEFLRRFLGEELMGRDEALRVSRVRAAKFEANAKSFASWKAELSSIDVEVQQALITLDWARRKEALVFFGPSGTGKSHLTGALSRHAIDQGLKVRQIRHPHAQEHGHRRSRPFDAPCVLDHHRRRIVPAPRSQERRRRRPADFSRGRPMTEAIT
ncbi:hypothetical protein GCM10029978_066110 [Actinoallomurus acanthiterrae]